MRFRKLGDNNKILYGFLRTASVFVRGKEYTHTRTQARTHIYRKKKPIRKF